MTEAEFVGFRDRAIANYADAMVRSGQWLELSARAQAEEPTSRRLPDGVNSANALLLTALDEEERVIAHAWIDLPDSPFRGREAWIYFIEILPEYRGQHLGRRLLEAFESRLRQEEQHLIVLNVFTHNSAARSLYESSGYDVVAVTMSKWLSEDPMRRRFDSI